jgi:hypothetical protein
MCKPHPFAARLPLPCSRFMRLKQRVKKEKHSRVSNPHSHTSNASSAAFCDEPKPASSVPYKIGYLTSLATQNTRKCTMQKGKNDAHSINAICRDSISSS